ncbi:ABC transporter permease [Paenibacillus contaminans]|uniref:Sugar ABC transporter permease n=1 Tax=Paenibacillus contaminans TaxID=450362 RepID=A0A329MAL9_9BACL|nr:ABC transporter permease subunit [Paenibacillus contaminans]RAV16698.1 sugar ABC transporter permease [Paenibacillus contaminans]
MHAAAAKRRLWKKHLPLHLMLLPGVLLLIFFHYIPMAGIVIAFQQFIPSKGFFASKWVGWDQFEFMLQMPGIGQVLWNTIYIAFLKIIFGQMAPIVMALLLNEVRKSSIKRTVQTLIYLPHFLSWVILGGILIDILSPSQGLLNEVTGWFGMKPIFFLGNDKLFPYVLVVTDVWKEFGFGTIVYLAALTSINPTLYEAAVMDGAGRWKQTIHVTLPGMLPIIVLMATLSLGGVLNAGFDQVFNLYNPLVYRTGDILDTFVYRLGLIDAQYAVATAVGLFKSVVSLIFVGASYWLAYRLAGYRIF